MENAMHRHGITERAWEIIAPHLPGKKGIGVVSLRIIVDSSMLLSGFCVQCSLARPATRVWRLE